jgi:phosphate uptake regulator
MNSHQYIQILRLHVLDMARVCQRAMDYSLKAHRLGSAECCTLVRNNTSEINALHLEIDEMIREILLTEILDESDLRFILAVERICKALQEIHLHADHIASNSLRLLESSRRIECSELFSMGDVVNRLMRLCVVALFEECIVHAEAVLRSDGVERELETKFFEGLSTLDRNEGTEVVYEIAVADSLGQMAREMHELADAIVFWLSDSERNSMPDTGAMDVPFGKVKGEVLEASR